MAMAGLFVLIIVSFWMIREDEDDDEDKDDDA